MSKAGESQEIVDHLRIQLTDGKGQKIYDSDDKIPNLGFPKEPLKFCPNCGGETQPVIYMCKGCGQRFAQQEDRKTGRKIVITLPDTVPADRSIV